MVFLHPACNEKTDGSYVNRPFCVTRWRRQQENREPTAPHLIFFCFFSSKKKRRGDDFLLEEKKQKTPAGEIFFCRKDGFFTSCLQRKTDGSYVNRPFCVTRWRRQQENREPTAPHLIFFCFFSSKKKRRGTIFYLKKRNKRHCGGDFLLQERRFFTSCLQRKNGRFVCEPSVLCNALAKATGEQRANCSALDFLLLLFF